MKGDSGFKGEKARHYYDANRKRFYFVFLISANVPYREPREKSPLSLAPFSFREGKKSLYEELSLI